MTSSIGKVIQNSPISKQSEIERVLLTALSDSGVSEEKWKDIFEREERDMVLFELKKRILKTAFDTIQDLEVQSFTSPFLVSCLHEAWKKVLPLACQWRDPRPCRNTWKEDKEPTPCPLDPWTATTLKTKSEMNIPSDRADWKSTESDTVSSASLSSLPESAPSNSAV